MTDRVYAISQFKIWLTFVFVMISFVIRAQNVAQNLENYTTAYSAEKAYLHFDKSSYSPGQTIWFKAYVMNEIVAAIGSKNFYVDWIDDQGRILKHTVAPLIEGHTNGQFDIPLEFKGTTLGVRAYTRWMLNFDSSFLYKKTINIFNQKQAKTAPSIVLQPVLDFSPEGGDLIVGLESKVAFKAADQWGRPVKVRGILLENGKPSDSLKVLHDGMGFVSFTPIAGTTYTANWKDEQGKEYTTALPEVKANGANLQITIESEKRAFRVHLSSAIATTNDSVYVIGSMYQHPIFQIAKSTKQDIVGVVPTLNLPYGVLTITLFDKNWKPLAERITYIENNAPYIIKPEMEVVRWGLSYRARDEVKIAIPKSTLASLSIAVTDFNIDADSSNNIISSLMLTSELKGRVHNPAYYFTNLTDKKRQDLDLVMLTNGWRRIKWEQVIAGVVPKINYPRDTSFLSLSGTAQGIIPGTIGNGSAVMMIVTQKDVQNKMLLTPVHRDGNFDDLNTIIFDTAQVYYQFQDKNLKGASLQFMPNKLRTPPLGKGFNSLIFPDTLGAARHRLLANELMDNTQRTKYKELEIVTVKAKTKSATEILDEKYASGLFSSGDAIQIDVLNNKFAKVGDIFTFLQGQVPGLQISGQGANTSLSWRGGSPQLYIDEVPTDISMASSININDVAYIKAFRPPFMGGFNGANGAIAVYTRRGNDVPREPGQGISSAKIEGYSGIREFYNPRYLTTVPPSGADRDVRTTLYWNPNVVIDPQTGQATISFYNNDVTDAFRVIIEGMTTDGKLMHLEEKME